MPDNTPPQVSDQGLDNSKTNERVKLATEFSGAEIVTEFIATLVTRSPATREVYARTLYRMAGWIAQRPGSNESFSAEGLTRTALASYLGVQQRFLHFWAIRRTGYNGCSRKGTFSLLKAHQGSHRVFRWRPVYRCSRPATSAEY